jgi:hypothetical protein
MKVKKNPKRMRPCHLNKVSESWNMSLSFCVYKNAFANGVMLLLCLQHEILGAQLKNVYKLKITDENGTQ